MSKKNIEENGDIMKAITLGESAVGKTSIIKRYIEDKFDENNLATIGIGASFKEIKLKVGKTFKLKLIDTAGQEKYRALAKSYFKNTDAVLFVFSFDDQKSFDNIKDWIKTFDENSNGKTGIPKYLVGNKSDKKRVVNDDLINKFKEEFKDFKYYETSAKKSEGIDKMFQDLGEDLYKILVEKKEKAKPQNAIKISKYNKNKKNSSNCMCSVEKEVNKYKD